MLAFGSMLASKSVAEKFDATVYEHAFCEAGSTLMAIEEAAKIMTTLMKIFHVSVSCVP